MKNPLSNGLAERIKTALDAPLAELKTSKFFSLYQELKIQHTFASPNALKHILESRLHAFKGKTSSFSSRFFGLFKKQ